MSHTDLDAIGDRIAMWSVLENVAVAACGHGSVERLDQFIREAQQTLANPPALDSDLKPDGDVRAMGRRMLSTSIASMTRIRDAVAARVPTAVEDRVATLERELAEAQEAFETVVLGLCAAVYVPGLAQELRQNSEILSVMPSVVGSEYEQERTREGRRLAGFVLRAIADKLDVITTAVAALPPSTETVQ